jgi:hypothetical protein
VVCLDELDIGFPIVIGADPPDYHFAEAIFVSFAFAETDVLRGDIEEFAPEGSCLLYDEVVRIADGAILGEDGLRDVGEIVLAADVALVEIEAGH